MSICTDMGECGPEIIKRQDVWCCVWCGMPIDKQEEKDE